MLAEFIDNIGSASVRVYPPTKRVMLCGGEVSKVTDSNYETIMKSLRDSCLRSRFSSQISGFPQFDFLLAEQIHEFYNKECPYLDLLDFEKDIAQICELVLLIAEGPGSFVELGSFSVFDGIREKLLVLIRRKHFNEISYISLGPVASLRSAFPNSVAILADSLVGIKADSLPDTKKDDFSNVDPGKVGRFLYEPLTTRISEAAARTTFDMSKFNHVCKLYTALLREFYVLKDLEIKELMECFGVEFKLISFEKMVFCCSILGWTSTTSAGFDRLHFAYPMNEAAQFDFVGNWKDKTRRRQLLRSYWENSDPHRVAAVDEELKP